MSRLRPRGALAGVWIGGDALTDRQARVLRGAVVNALRNARSRVEVLEQLRQLLERPATEVRTGDAQEPATEIASLIDERERAA